MALGDISREGSSDSSSGGAGDPLPEGGAIAGEAVRWMPVEEIGVTFGSRESTRRLSAAGSIFFGSSRGVSSTVECLPVVHGGIVRNSSKVRTRGLQHFQPIQRFLESFRTTGHYYCSFKSCLQSMPLGNQMLAC